MVCTERLRAQLEELEPRILYSADVASVLGLAAGAAATQGLQEQQLLTTASSAVSQASTHEIAFVDLAAPDAQALVAGLTAQRESGRSIELVTIAANEDGLAVISQTLDHQRDITAVHLFSHGSAGSIQLGSAVLDSRSALLRAGELAGWSTALTTDADLLIYGCDVASNNAGLALIQDLASLTGADVAASDDATGAAGLGGDWLLEQQVGVIDAASLLPPQAFSAFAGLLGNDRPVNTTTPNQQDTDALNRGSQQAVAMDDAGNHVVVWTSKNQDGDGLGVYARRFSLDGTALSAEIQINTTTVNDQFQPRVAMDAAGNFVVVWVDSGQNGGDVMFRRFDAAGNALAGEQRANATTTGLQTNAVIGMNRSTGDFVLAWQGEGPGDTAGIFMRRFNASGTAMDATDIRVNSSDAGIEQNPAVAMDTSNRVVVAFDVANHMYFQRFDANGVLAGGRTQVDNGFSNSVGASIAMDAAGNFTLAYREQGSIAPGIWGRGYLANGTQRYTWFYTDNGDADGASIAMDATGNFVVTYQKTGANGLDIFARKYNANGSPNGSAFTVNQHTTNNQTSASVAMVLRNDFVVVWSGKTASDSYGVDARSFEGSAPVITSLGGGASTTLAVAENTSAVATVTATDADGDTLTYSITGGADAAKFSIVASTGALSFVTAPDFEARADADANNAYELTVTVSDGLRTDEQTIVVQVADVFEPSIAVSDSAGTSLNTAVLVDVLANDQSPQGSGLQILDVSNPAHGTASTTPGGVVYTPTAGYAGVDSFNYRMGNTDDGLVNYWRLDGNATAGIGGLNGTLVGAPSTVDGFWGSALRFDGVSQHVTLPDVAYANQFTLSLWFRMNDNQGSGYRYVYSHGDVATANSVNVFFIEDATTTASGTTNVLRTRLRDANDADNLSGLDIPAASLADGQWHQYTLAVDAGTSRVYIDGTMQASMAAGGDSFNPSGPLILGANQTKDSQRFFKGDLDGVALFNRSLSPSEVAGQFASSGSTSSASVSVAVANTAPVITSDGGGNVALITISENSAAVTTVTASDADLPAQPLSYAISGGVDAALFSINSATGVLRFIAAPDFELPGDADADNTYEVEVQVTDSGMSDTQALSVRVQPVNEHAPVFNLSGALATGAVQVDENVLSLATLTALDADLPATGLTYSVVGGADASLFTINPSSGALAFRSGPDFELPSDADLNNIYYVTVQVSDGDFQDQVALRFMVNDVNEAALSALSDSDAAANQVLESGAAGTPVGITLHAVDADIFSSTVSYALTDDDGGRFAVDSSTGVVTLARALGEDAQLQRTITVRADSSDGSFSTSSFNITVLPVNSHAPVIQSDGAGATASVQVDEGETFVTTVAASDADLPLQALQFSLVGGADAALFSIDASSGVLQMLAPADFENPLDADRNGIYDVTVEVSDGAGMQDSQSISVQVHNRDEAPVWLDNRLSIAEGASAAPLVQVFDPDSTPSALRFDIQGLSGGRFELVTSPGLAISGFSQADLAAGRVRFVADGGEAAPSYQLVLGDGTTTLPANAAAVAFTPVNDAPVAGPPVDLGQSDEDQALVIDAASLLAGAQDVEADVLAVTGLRVLAGNASITELGDGRWQLQPGADWNGTVSLAFEVSDGVATAGGSAHLQVQPVNDAPVLTHPSGVSGAVLSVPENTQAVTVLTASDIDTATSELRFAIVGGADAALFQLDARTGALSLLAAPDYEAPQDADGNGRYELIVSVSDAQAQVTQALVVSVLGVDEAPVVSRQALLVSAQGLTLVLQAQDPEGATKALVYEVLATQGGQFELVTADGRQSALSFTQADVDAGRVQFVRDGSGTEPSFKLALSDGINRIELSRPELIHTVDPVQPEVPAPTRAAESSFPPIVSPQPEPAEPVAVAASPSPPVQSAAARPPADTAPTATPAAPFVATDVPRLAGPQARAGSNEPGVPAARGDAGSAGGGFWMQSIAALQLVSDEPLALRETMAVEGFISRNGNSLAQAMDAARLDEHPAQEGLLQLDSAGAVLISGGLSVGYVLWLARGGALVASLMSSVPAWSSVDPLPVLAQARRASGDDEEAEGEEIDPVDQLFSRARRLLRNAPPASPPPPSQSSPASSPQTTSRTRADQHLREETEWAS